jgi:hypothetical protein
VCCISTAIGIFLHQGSNDTPIQVSSPRDYCNLIIQSTNIALLNPFVNASCLFMMPPRFMAELPLSFVPALHKAQQNEIARMNKKRPHPNKSLSIQGTCTNTHSDTILDHHLC